MFLTSIYIQNFRGIEALNLDFEKVNGSISTRKWTIILGENGTGKSNLLKAIALVTAGSNVIGELIGNPSDWISFGENFCFIQANLRTQETKNQTVSLRIERGNQLSDIVRNNTESLSLLDNALQKSNQNYFLVAYGAYRKLRDNKSLGKNGHFSDHSRTKRIATLFNRDASLHSIEAWAMDLDYRKEKKGLAIVKKALDEFLPEVSFHSIDKKKKRILFDTPSGTIPLEFLSDGYQNMAGWLGDLLFHITEAFEDYKNALSTRGVLLIDELELHLHPLWQRLLVAYLDKMLPNFQIIATTHAPLAAQQAPEDSLYFLKRDEHKKLQLTSFRGNPQLVRVEQLMRTPAFGVSTVVSLEVQEKKETYQRLKDKNERTVEEEKELEQTATFLRELPNISYETPQQKEQFDLLKRIENHLKAK